MDTLSYIFNTNDKTHPSLGHGEKFNKHRSNSKSKGNNNCDSEKEWFYNRNMNSFGFQEGFATKKSYNELRSEYNDILSEFRRVSGLIADAESDYINKTTTNSGNIYLNKNIQFKNSVIAYVTNKGVVKKYATLDMFNKTAGLNGCPDKNYVNVNIDWISAYDVPGATIQMPTIGSVRGPKLIVGAVMTRGESCGNEGSNVIVDKMMNTVRSQFMGCFDNSITTAGYPMGNSYYGGGEPYVNYIQNGNFALSSYSGVGDVNITTDTVTNWTTTAAAGLVVLINKGNTATSGNLAYPITYPNGERAVSLKNAGDLSQTFTTGLVAGNYMLTFNACGLTTANPIAIFLNSDLEAKGTITPDLTWKSYGVQLPSASSITKITFKGTGTAGQMSAIQNIRLTNGTASGYTNAVDFSTCETAAKTGSYSYFGLQNVDQDTTSSNFGKGFCVLSKDTSLIPTLNSANDLSPEPLLQKGTATGDTRGISATLTELGVLLVNTATTPIPVSTNTGSSNNTPCYLILADDGTMKIYKFPKDSNGNFVSIPPDLADPSKPPVGDNFIWSSGLPTKQLMANPTYTAANGKGKTLILNGQSWVTGGTVLSPGEFIGSPSGKIYLIMGTNGVLSLNTSKYATTCKTNSVSKVIEGGVNSAGLYKVNSDSDNLFTTLGKLFFINDDASLKTYPATNKKFSNEYIEVKNYNTPAETDALKYNISATSGKTLADCKSACDLNTNCYGYSYTTSGSTCNLKGSNLSQDKGDGPTTAGTDLYVRKETYKSNILGVTNTFSSIFSTQKNNYSVDSANPNVPTSYGVKTLVPDLRTQLSDLQNQLDDLQSQMNVYSGSGGSGGYTGYTGTGGTGYTGTGYTGTGTGGTSNTSNTGSSSLNSIADYITEIQSNEKKISAIKNVKNTNLDNMIQDTDLIVLQENYKYLCWSILAAASVLVFVNVSN
jgi:hypothetical protein